ncbi:MAG: D-tyrosyl-tRNA(Tyr) deacylase [Acidobacteria bacterium]|nr:D-tyrosyl-tRNA(Tyr) deacylase [Acidobacteriota bacterium]
MRAVLQRVSQARVEVEGEVVGSIGRGLVVLLGIGRADTTAEADYLVEKVLGLRIFPDEERKMNRSVVEAGGSLLVISQFTLYGDTRKGRRPSFDEAAPPEEARRLYEYFVEAARARQVHCEAGIFQAMMDVHLTNEGPVTIICESPRR